MSYLISNKLKRISGWVFYLSISFGTYFFFTEKLHEIFTIKVFSIFSNDTLFGTSGGLTWIENGFLDEIFTFLIIVSGIINSFSKEKIEDELISKIRMESLVLSLYINYGLLLVSNFLVFGLSYFNVLIFHLYILLLLFNLIFKYRLNRHYKS